MKRILLTTVLVPFGLAIGGCSADDTAIKSNNSEGTSGDSSGTSAGDNGTAGNGNGTAGNGNGTAGDGNGTAGNGNGMGGNGNGMGGNGQGGVAGGMAGAGGGGNGMDPCAAASYDAAKCMDLVAGGKSNFGYAWKDSWFITGCAQKAGHDCITIPSCPNAGLPDAQFEDKGSVVNETFPVGGTTDADYLVSFKFNGVSEGKFYSGGSWAQPATDLATPGAGAPAIDEAGIAANNFYVGGKAVPSNYNVMRIRVLDSKKTEIAHYYMNGYDANSGAESHRTFLLSYAHTIPVKGGGFIEYHIADSNCHAIDNCGAGGVSDTVCDAARNIPNENNVQLPAMYTDVSKQATTPPGTPKEVLVTVASLNPITKGAQPWHSQISHFTITKVVGK